MKRSYKISEWLLQGVSSSDQSQPEQHVKSPWYKVMCLTGVDYFSTLGYQPSVAFLAAGLLSPVATVILVIVTLFAALPAYAWVARYSPHGQGSISMLEKLLPGWRSKLIVLFLLGFAAMGFIITITLSAADAAAHIVENPILGHWLTSRMLVTMFLVALLGGIFLKGFKEVIGLAVCLVGLYLSLNVILLSVGFYHIFQAPHVVIDWWAAVRVSYPSVWQILAVSVIVFPRLALGMSGFETGVMVMPLIDGGKGDEGVDENGEPRLEGRIANTKKLLRTAALIMSLLLVTSSIVTSMLIPQSVMAPGGAADGRALAYLAHLYLGPWFGSLYDLSSVCILWFAGASAMAGLVNLVPKYLPRYGMAPEWARAVRPLVIFFTGVCFFVTYVFHADVNSQSAAYATGVLVFLTAAAFAVALALWDKGWVRRISFSAITTVFVYTTLDNVWERPDGVQVALFFLAAILVTSLISRIYRSTELRISEVKLDEQAEQFITESLAHNGRIELLAHRPGGSAYAVKLREMVFKHGVPEEKMILVEAKVSDSSDFTGQVLEVRGVHKGDGGHPVLQCQGPAVANAIAALSLHIRDKFEKVPDVYFGWTEGNPLLQAFKFLFVGEGEIALMTREVLRGVEQDVKKRPRVHVA